MKYPRCRSTRWFTLIFITSRSIVRNKRTAVLSLLLPWPLSNVIFIPNARCNCWYGISQDTDGLNESFLISLTTADMTLSRCIKEMRIKKTERQKKCIYLCCIKFYYRIMHRWMGHLAIYLTVIYKNNSWNITNT